MLGQESWVVDFKEEIEVAIEAEFESTEITKEMALYDLQTAGDIEPQEKESFASAPADPIPQSKMALQNRGARGFTNHFDRRFRRDLSFLMRLT
jgi:hypothetical protein